jgi:hypothetical protein
VGSFCFFKTLKIISVLFFWFSEQKSDERMFVL